MIVLSSRRSRVSRVLFEFRASDCVDEAGLFARSYGSRLAAVLSRPSRKRLFDQNGEVFAVPVGSPAIGHFGDELAALFELARTNLCIRSEEFDTWSNGGTPPTVTANAIAAPNGTLTADLITAVATGSRKARLITFTGDGEKALSLFLRNGVGNASRITLHDTTAATGRHTVRVTWVAGVPTLVTDAGNGVLFPVEPLARGWYRISFSVAGVVAANNNEFRIVPDQDAGTGSVYAWGAQAENAAVPSSYIPTADATVTREGDSCYFNVPALNPPRAMTLYVRGNERGNPSSSAVPQEGVLFIGTNSSTTDPRFGISKTNLATGYRSLFDDGTTAVNSEPRGTGVTRGSTVELRGILSSDGGVNLGLSINGADESVGTKQSGGSLQPAWAGIRLYIGKFGGAQDGLFAFTHVIVAEGERSLDEMRQLAGI